MEIVFAKSRPIWHTINARILPYGWCHVPFGTWIETAHLLTKVG